MRDLTELTRFGDRVSFLYLEKGRIEQHLTSVAYVTENQTVPIPVAGLALLMLVQAGIITAGYSPAIGFIHTGKALSFVYDIADLYKVALIVPVVFELVAQGKQQVERRARIACRDLFHRTRLLERILPDIEEVLYEGKR